MDEQSRKVEAILFTVGKEITPERIAHLCHLEKAEVESLLEQLQQEYAQRDHSLQLMRKDNGWKLTVRDAYIPLVSSVAEGTELDRPLTETLAVIAWKYPLLQSEVIKLRGSSAYEHMKLLEEQGFIAKEKQGRSFNVKLTGKFFEYFDLPSEEAKQAFLKQIPSLVLQEAEQVDKEIDETERLLEKDKLDQEARKEIKIAIQDAGKMPTAPETSAPAVPLPKLPEREAENTTTSEENSASDS